MNPYDCCFSGLPMSSSFHCASLRTGRRWIGPKWTGRSLIGRSLIGRNWIGRSWIGAPWWVHREAELTEQVVSRTSEERWSRRLKRLSCFKKIFQRLEKRAGDDWSSAWRSLCCQIMVILYHAACMILGCRYYLKMTRCWSDCQYM